MKLQISVPTIACEVCGNNITKAIQAKQSDAEISVDVANKIVTVETAASEADIRAIITDAGHEPA